MLGVLDRDACAWIALYPRDQEFVNNVRSKPVICNSFVGNRLEAHAIELPGVFGKTKLRSSALDDLIEIEAIVEIDLTEDQINEFPSKRLLGGRTTYISLPPEDL